MSELPCKSCDNVKRKNKDFLCDEIAVEDSLSVRCTHHETFLKLKVLRYYLEIFCVAMKEKYEYINFLDLFAGPGICYDKDYNNFDKGSSLIALDLKYPFTKYIFVDSDEKTQEILRKRCEYNFPNLLNRIE